MLQPCGRCRLPCDAASFYPNVGPGAWCKDCILRRRRLRVSKATVIVQQRERTQAAIRHVIRDVQRTGQSYVYLLRQGGRFKIGYSKNIDRRLRTFNTAVCSPAEVLVIAPGDRATEHTLHRQFAAVRLTREWFSPNPRIVQMFRTLHGALSFLPGEMTAEAPAATESVELGAS